MNEPEGSLTIAGDSNPCYDTNLMGQYGAGWTNSFIPMERFLWFINKLSAAVKREDSKALVTLGSWSEHPQSDAFADTRKRILTISHENNMTLNSEMEVEAIYIITY